VIFFVLISFRNFPQISHCGPFEAEDPKRYQNHVFNPLKAQQTPGPFHMGTPQPHPTLGLRAPE